MSAACALCAESVRCEYRVHLVCVLRVLRSPSLCVESTASQLLCVLRVLHHTWAMRAECCVTPGLLLTCPVPWKVSAVLDLDSEEGDQDELMHHSDTVADPAVKCAQCFHCCCWDDSVC